MKSALFVLSALVAFVSAGTVDLAGEWRFALDPKDTGMAVSPDQWRFPDTIKLPGTVAAQGFGDEPSFKTTWTGDGWRYPEMFKEWQVDGNFKFPFFLQPPRHYAGPAWYRREIVIPEDWKDSQVRLHLERVHWHSSVWVDDRKIGNGDSLGTPHVFDLGTLSPGKHQLTLRVDNRIGEVNVGPLSHSVTDHTQGNWNGVVGKMELQKLTPSGIHQIQVFPKMDGSLKVIVTGWVAERDGGGAVGGMLRRMDSTEDSMVLKSKEVTKSPDGSFKVELHGKTGKAPQLWSEFTPEMYEFIADLQTPNQTQTFKKSTTFGFREVGTKEGRITVNGRKTFLRGTLECCIFPLTGHPPVDVESWRRIIRICKAHGLNHIRFHSWCPPEAAFVAADELGFYYQVEVSSWANQGAEIGSGRPLDAWLEDESGRMLAIYGNHPSFLMMAYGNEPAGGNHPKWLQEWVAKRKLEDPRRLYTTAAGWPIRPGSDFHSSPDPRIQAWGGGLKSVINAEAPGTDFDWSAFVKKHSDAPVVSHEIGQWCVYPNFAEIKKYTGYFKARNFEIFRETARRSGLLEQSEAFLMASGKLQALAYKHDIEAALRTPGFGGFQLLDLHDFPGQGTALVGVLDAFWDEKGYISPEQYRRFCGPIVPLARMKKMVLTTDDVLEADLELAQFGPEDLTGVRPVWSLAGSDGKVVAEGSLPVRDLPSGELHPLGAIRVPLAKFAAPAKLTLTVGAAGHDFSNSWELFVYPGRITDSEHDGVLITRGFEEAKASLAKGGKVLWMPPAAQVRNDSARPLVSGFSPVFWNTAWTSWQPPHTLGILCDPDHPAFATFPTDFHSNWQWWEILRNTQPFILTELREVKPVVQMIDDWFTNRKLGHVFEARIGKGKLLACSFDLDGDLQKRPAARQLKSSLLRYIGGAGFDPQVVLESAQIESLLRQPPLMVKLGATASASGAEDGFAASAAIDGDPATLWHTEFSSRKPGPPHELVIGFKSMVSPAAVVLTQRQDGNPNGQVREIEILDDAGKILVRAVIPKGANGHGIRLPAGTKVAKLSVKVVSTHSGPFAAIAEVDLKP